MFNKSNFKILAVETSCDETAAAVIEADRLPTTANHTDIECRILSNVVSSQIEIHRKFGGVFPELASRAHSEKIIPVVEQAFSRKAIKPKATTCYKIDAIAVTVGPGLIGSLLIGVNFAKTYAYANHLPIIGINHLSGHLYSNWADKPLPELPAIVLIVSGGHTGLYLMKSHTDIQTLGETLDDAAGEAFDKVAKLLGLDYPGGPAIATAAAKIRNPKSEIRNKSQITNIKFPRSMLDKPGYNFSFSGLKTAVLYKVKDLESQGTTLNHYQSLIAYEFQQAVIDILIGKTVQAALEFHPKSICLCGGVSANKELREQMEIKIKKEFPHITFHKPNLLLSTDNAAMIGIAASYHLDKVTSWNNINANANLKL